MIKIVHTAIMACLGLAALMTPARAQPMKLTVSYTGTGSTHIPIFIARETGISAKNSLEVQVVRAQAIVSTMALNPPTIFVAEKEGFRILTDVSGLPGIHVGILRSEPD